MIKEFKLPDVGEGIAQAEIVEYLVEVGDKVKADQDVVRVETDKAVVELPAPVSGTIAEILHEPGDTVNVGDVLLTIETDEKAGSKDERQEPLTPMPPSAPPQEPEPKEKKPATPPQDESSVRKEQKETRAQAPPTGPSPDRVLATPHTRKLARELKVDITTVKATGSHGRITDEDIRKAAEGGAPAEEEQPKAAPAAKPARQQSIVTQTDLDEYGPTHRETLKGIRKRTAEVMAESVSTTPSVTHFDEADVTDLMEVVRKQKAVAADRNVHLTVSSFVAKAAVSALKRHPKLNCSLDVEKGEIIFKDYYNLGFATDTEAGLMVPVLRDVDTMSIIDIAEGLQALGLKARDRSITREEMLGATFTITNVGSIGGRWATPIIVPPQSAILCLLRAKPQPVVLYGEVVIRTIMPLTLSFDHRALDGADAAKFVNSVIRMLEDPMRMLVEMS